MSRSTALTEAVKYLVLMRLSGNTAGLMSVLDYANGVSPSGIEQGIEEMREKILNGTKKTK
jgi:hypothetical protein